MSTAISLLFLASAVALSGAQVPAQSASARRLTPWPKNTEIVVTCSTDSTCGGNGVCQSGQCKCDDKYYTTDRSSPCGTEKKSKTTAILLHVFLGGVGAGAFYAGWTGWGVAMIILCCSPVLFACCAACCVAGATGGDEGALKKVQGVTSSGSRGTQVKSRTSDEKKNSRSYLTNKHIMADVKKEELLGAVAIKPVGWDRTGWEAFGYFLYDPDNGTVLSRTPKSWALITIFYTIYYTCLACFWYVCLLIFFSTLPDAVDGPKWQQEASLIGINPGVGIRPLNQDSRIDSNIFMLQDGDNNMVPSTRDGEGDLNIDYARRAELFMEVYNKPAGDDYLDFDTASLGPCANHPYGFVGDNLSPCVFLKFNKIWGWTPTPITEEDFAENEWPESFHDHWKGESDQQKIWVDCQGRNPADKEALSGVEYFPESRGFETKYFPFQGNKDEYHSPLVAVQFSGLPKGQLIHVECRSYYQGVRHETKSKTGLVTFEILVKS